MPSAELTEKLTVPSESPVGPPEKITGLRMAVAVTVYDPVMSHAGGLQV